jgi:hypothetical protein
MSKKTKRQIAALQEEVEILRAKNPRKTIIMQRHVSAEELFGGCSFEIHTACKEPEKDYHNKEALFELVTRMSYDRHEVTAGELRKIFENDLDLLIGWLHSFMYIGALNGCMLNQGSMPEDTWVWDGSFENRGTELWYVGGAGASRYGHAETKVKDDDLIFLF